MAHESTTQSTCYPEEKKLYMALELSKAKWLVRCSSGGRKAYQEIVLPNDKERMATLVGRAKKKLGLPEGAKVVSCYEAGRDGFWIHRFLENQGIENIVIDAASMKVSRHGRRAKNDSIDVKQLLNDLVRFHRGDDDVWRVVRVPSEETEDDRRPHRELGRLKKERTQHRNRIRSLLATHGIQVTVDLMKLFSNLDRLMIWNGQPLPKNTKAEIKREYRRLELVESDIADIKKDQSESVKNPASAKLGKVAKLQTLRGVGLDSAWLIVMELLGWRTFSNRREVGAAVGLVGTPYDSGEMDREQGISKAGNQRVRTRLIELSWLWLRYQPNSDLTKWFNQRYAESGKRSKRIGIVAVARRLLIQLWHFVEHDVKPKDAIIVKP